MKALPINFSLVVAHSMFMYYTFSKQQAENILDEKGKLSVKAGRKAIGSLKEDSLVTES